LSLVYARSTTESALEYGEMGAAVAAIVPAAGTGRRLGGQTAKTFAPLDGLPLIVHPLRTLQDSAMIRWIILVVQPSHIRQALGLLRHHRITKALPPCPGGSSRAESVARGFAMVPREARWVLIHDGARPCVKPQLITRSVRAARRYGAVACGLPASLTVKAVDAQGHVRLTLDREQLWLVQTPQVFRRDWFAQALQRACRSPSGRDGTQANHGLEPFPDDAAVVEAAGFSVRMIPGDPLNLKVTTQEDLLFVRAVLRERREPKARR
jgi:2-C-methyl-D-erythritol 4-phosphate cytidylyltransferase